MASYPVLVDPSRSDSLIQLANDTDGLNAKLASQQSTDSLGWVSPLIALLQLGATVGSWFWNRSQQREQNEYQRQLIDEQNAYNSPAAQLNRLIGAGVPANTALASLTGSVGSQTQPMSGQAAPYTPVQPPSLGDLSHLATLKDQHDLAQAQVRNLDADSYSKDPENPLNVAQRVLHENQALLSGNQAERERALMNLDEAQRQQALQNIAYMRILGRKARWEGTLAMKDAKKRNEWIDSQIDSLAAKAGVDRATASRILFELAVSHKYDAAMSQVNSQGRTGYQEEVYSQFISDLASKEELRKLVFLNTPISNWQKDDMEAIDDWLTTVYYLSYVDGSNKTPGMKLDKVLRHGRNFMRRGQIVSPILSW